MAARVSFIVSTCGRQIIIEGDAPPGGRNEASVAVDSPPACWLLAADRASAQGAGERALWPDRAVRIIVPFPAGGPTDILARVLGQRLSEDWGQPVVIENRPGGDTVIAAQQVAKAAPDGYTLLAAMDTTLVMNPATKKNLPYDPHKDFAYITMASQNTSLLSVRADDGPKTVQELIATGKGQSRQAQLRRRHHHHPARRLPVRARGRASASS